MRPCSFHEAWEPLIQSGKKTNTLPPQNVTLHHIQQQQPNIQQIPNQQNNHPIQKGSSTTPIHITSGCDQYLLHLISCPHCIQKLKDLSKIYNMNNNSPSQQQLQQLKMFEQFANQPEQFPFINKLMQNIQKNDRFNDMVFSIIVGILIAYVVMNVSKK